MWSCCPFGVVRFLVCSYCFPSLIRLSFVVLHLLLWSFCCPAVYVAVQDRNWGCGQQQFLPTKLFGVYAGMIFVGAGLILGGWLFFFAGFWTSKHRVREFDH